MAVRVDLNISLDGFATTTDETREKPFGPDWSRLVEAYIATRTFRARVLHETSGEGTTGVDDQYAQAYFAEIGAEFMGAGMFGLHAAGDDPDWRGWWGDEPPFRVPVFVLTHKPRPVLEMAGGIWKSRKIKAVIPGGSSVPVVPGDTMMKVNMDYDSLKAIGSSVGSAAVIVMDETTCMVRTLERLARFYMSESCGQCTPCREGTGWLTRTLRRIMAGEATREHLGLLLDVANRIEGHTICALGDAAAWPVQSFLKHYRHEFEFMVDHGGRSIVAPDAPRGTQVAA